MSEEKKSNHVAIEEIRAILKKHDLAGAVCIYGPETTSAVIMTDTSYSLAKEFDRDGEHGMAIECDAKQFPGGRKAMIEAMKSTGLMFKNLSTAASHINETLEDVSEEIITEVKRFTMNDMIEDLADVLKSARKKEGGGDIDAKDLKDDIFEALWEKHGAKK